MKDKISEGIVHKIPSDWKKVLISNSEVLEKWSSLTPISRDEWICWIISVKKSETRKNHIERARNEILEGKRRPCCWPGCSHR